MCINHNYAILLPQHTMILYCGNNIQPAVLF